MVMLSPFLFLLVFLIQKASTASSDCGSACQYPLSDIEFEGADPAAGYYARQCTSRLGVQSAFLCMRHYCTEDEIAAGLSYLNSNCEEYGDVSLLPWSVIGNISEEEYLQFPHIQYENLSSASAIYETPVFIDRSLFDLSYRTMVYWDESFTARAHYAYALYGFFAGVFAISLTYRASHFVLRHHRQGVTFPKLTYTTFRKSLFLTPLPQNAWGRVPSHIESITIATFVILNVVLCCVSYKLFDRNLYWPSTRLQLWRYLSDRTGVLSIANVPLIWAFGTRNNVLLWITGWSFSTFNSFHRWVARVATIEAIIHSIGYTVFAFRDGGSAEYNENWAEQYWWMGAIATICMAVMTALAIYPLRKHAYDMFLILHIAFAVLFIVSLWYHVAIMDGEYNGYIWPCVAVWAFDRVLRLARVLLVNKFPLTGAAIYDKASDIIRLQVPVPKRLRPQAGNHYYVYMLHGWKPWESHPFTLMSWRESNDGAAYEFSFLISPQKGMTRTLRQRLSTNEPETICSLQNVRVVLEGPYGSNHNVSQYPAVLLIAGGSGITAIVSHLRTIQQHLEEDTSQRVCTRNIRLVWAIRDVSLFHDVYRNELLPICTSSNFSSRIAISISVHVTGSSTTVSGTASHDLGDTFGPSKEDKSRVSESTISENNDSMNVSISHNRPIISSVVLDTAEKWAAPGGRLAVVSCGPESMANDVSQTVADALDKGYDGVELFSEEFCW